MKETKYSMMMSSICIDHSTELYRFIIFIHSFSYFDIINYILYKFKYAITIKAATRVIPERVKRRQKQQQQIQATLPTKNTIAAHYHIVE